jgi:hypothetical protein
MSSTQVSNDVDAARAELLSHGAEVSEVLHDAGGGLAGGFHPGTEGRAPGRDPEDRSYASYASYSDPMVSRDSGSGPDQASGAAGRHMAEVNHVIAPSAT